MAADQVLIEEKGHTRILTLNRPQKMNALSFPMIIQLLKQFTAYEDDPNVKLLILKGKGKAFCVGGDAAAVYHSIAEGHWTVGAKFYYNESILNYIIATYAKPQVSILNGIVIGGGASISIHGRFCVVTENAVFSMPETALGLFSHIGGSYFLSRLPGFFEEYLGLTGARLDGAEMLSCGLATHFVHSSKLPSLEELLVKVDTSDPLVICRIIDKFSHKMPVKASSVCNRLDIVDKCFSKRTVEEIIFALEQEALHGSDEWIMTAIHSLKKASPISLKISLRSIREGRIQSLRESFIQVYRTCCNVIRGAVSKDFFEGCRAILVDKDRNPKWEPSGLELIDDKMVDKYFAKVDEAEWEDLKLPAERRPAINISNL